MRRILPVFLVVVFYVALVPLGLADVGDRPWGFVLPIATVALTAPLFVLLHELGHLLVALLVGLPVAEIRIRLGRPSFVRVTPDPGAPALPVRFVLFALAGPVTNLAIAAGLYSYALGPTPDRERHCLLAAALSSALMGLANLVPERLADDLYTDGLTVQRWIFQPGRQRAALTARRQLMALKATVAGPVMARLRDGTIADDDLDEFIADDGTDPRLASLARALRLRRTLAGDHIVSIIPEAADDYERLRADVLAPDASPAVVDAVAPMLAVYAGLAQLIRTVIAGEVADPAYTTYVTEMAGVLAGRPESPYRSVVLALDDLLRGRAAEARGRLSGISPSEEAVPALLLRAVAEAALGDHAQADRLVNAARRVSPTAEIPSEYLRLLTAMRANHIDTHRLKAP